MDVPAVWLPTPLYSALIRLQLDNFTPIECVTAAYGSKREPHTHRRRYGFIYNHLIRLVNLGLLKRKSADDSWCSNYVKTPKFYTVAFQEEVIVQEPEKETNAVFLDELEARARDYRLLIQEYYAAFVEYKDLRQDFPDLEMTIENALNRSYEKYREFRGKLSAVEAVMKALGGTSRVR
jgi:hypothetical protein